MKKKGYKRQKAFEKLSTENQELMVGIDQEVATIENDGGYIKRTVECRKMAEALIAVLENEPEKSIFSKEEIESPATVGELMIHLGKKRDTYTRRAVKRGVKSLSGEASIRQKQSSKELDALEYVITNLRMTERHSRVVLKPESEREPVYTQNSEIVDNMGIKQRDYVIVGSRLEY